LQFFKLGRDNIYGGILAAAVLPNILMLVVTVLLIVTDDKLKLLSNPGSGCSQMGIAIIVLVGGNPYTISPLYKMN
jgi:hypothetical protein